MRFYLSSGILIDSTVLDAKPLIRDLLLKAQQAIPYSEPSELVLVFPLSPFYTVVCCALIYVCVGHRLSVALERNVWFV